MSEAKRRLFVAVTPPDELLEALESETKELRARWPQARWAARSNQHLTLKFLGWTPEDRVDAVCEATGLVARSHVAARIALSGLGSFPSKRRMRILWAGFDDPRGLLTKMAADLDRAFEPLGYATEERPFTPHLTLARFKTPVPLHEPLPVLDVARFAVFEVAELRLYESHLHPSGARYEVAARFELGRSK